MVVLVHEQAQLAAVAEVEECEVLRRWTGKEVYIEAEDLSSEFTSLWRFLFLRNRRRLRLAMRFTVALCAQCDEVQVGIIAGVAAKLLAMDL